MEGGTTLHAGPARTLLPVSDPSPAQSPGTDVATPCGSAAGACGGSAGCGDASGSECASAASSTACCGGGQRDPGSLTQERRAIVVTGLVGVAVTLAGLVIGGWVGFAMVALVAAGIAAALARSWPRLSRNDRMIRLAVLLLVLALALIRAVPR